MYAFTADRAEVLVFDGFGLTRLSLDGRSVKTNERVAGRWCARVGDRIALTDNAGVSRCRVLGVEKLTNVSRKKLELRLAVPHPDGAHLLAPGRAALDLADSDGIVVGSVAFDATGALDVGTLPLGRTLAHPPSGIDVLATADDDGTLAVYDPSTGRLFRGRVQAVREMIDVPWWRRLMGRRPLIDAVVGHVPAPIGSLTLVVAAGWALLATFEPSRNLASGILLGPDGAKKRVERGAVGALTFDGTWLAWQLDDATIARESLDGRTERISLPAEARGVGEVASGGESLLFVPPDREAVVDLRTSRRIERRLAPGTQEDRAAVLAFLRRANERGRRFDVQFELDAMTTPGVDGVKPRFSWTRGDLGLFAALVVGEFVADLHERWRPASVDLLFSLRPTAPHELFAGLTVVDELGLSLERALGFCDAVFRQAIGGRGTPAKRAPHRVFEADAGRRFLSTVTAALGGHAGTLASVGRAAGDLDLEALVAAVARAPTERRWPGDLRQALAWLLIEELGADAWPVLFGWLVDAPGAYADANTYNASEPIVRLCELHPTIREPMRVRCAAAAEDDDEKRGRRARSVLQALDAAR